MGADMTQGRDEAITEDEVMAGMRNNRGSSNDEE